MPIFERKSFISILMDENKKIKDHREQEMSKAKNRK